MCLILVGVMIGSVGCASGNKNSKSSQKKNVTVKKEGKDKAESKAEIPERYKKIIGMFNNIYDFNIPYFGGYGHKDKQIVIFSENSDDAVIWNFDGKGNTKVIKKDMLPEEKLYSSFAEGNLNNRKTTYVMYEDDISSFVLAVHEGYHFYGQDWINKIQMGSYLPRGTFYPENKEARQLNYEMLESLKKKINGEDEDGDGKALFFHNKYLNEQNKDYEGNLSTNIAEGTANFIEKIFLAAAQNPEKKNDLTIIAKKAFEMEKKHIDSYQIDKANEYYHISSLPYFYLTINGKHDLLKDISNTRYPYALLNEVTKPKAVELSQGLKEKVYGFYSKKNKELSPILDKEISKMKSEKIVKIKLGNDVFPGSMQFGEFINFRINDVLYTLNTATTAESTKEKGVILNNADIISNEMGEFILLISPEEIKIENRTLNVELSNIKIKTKDFKKVSDKEFIIK